MLESADVFTLLFVDVIQVWPLASSIGSLKSQIVVQVPTKFTIVSLVFVKSVIDNR